MLNTLRHLSYNIFMFWGKMTSGVGKGEVQNNIDETHNKITIIATDIHDDTMEHTKEHTKEHGHLGDRVEFIYQGGKMVFWIVASVELT